MQPEGVRWLHISDIDGKHQEVRASIASIAKAAEDMGGVDLVVVTGELVPTFQIAMLETVRDALTELRDALVHNGTTPRMVIVPGDQDRSPERAGLAARALEQWFEDADLREYFQTDADLLKLAVDGFSPFWKVMSPLMPDVHVGKIPGDCSFTLSAGLRLGIVGLNSEFLAPAVRRRQKLRTIEEWQVEAAVSQSPEEFCASHDAVLVAMHAPLRSIDARSMHALSRLLDGRGIVLCSPDGANPRGILVRDGIRHFPAGPFPDFVALGELKNGLGETKAQIRSVRFSWQAPLKIFMNGIVNLDDPGASSVSTYTPSVRLQRIIIQNFRGIKDLEIPLVSDPASPLGGMWTCIAGVNGVGKSAVLQAIALVCLPDADIRALAAYKPQLRRHHDQRSYDATIVLEWKDEEQTRRRTIVLDENRNASISGDPLAGFPLVVGYGATRNLSDEVRDSTDASRAYQQIRTLFDPLSQVANAEKLLAQTRDSRLWSIVEQMAKAALGTEFSIEQRGEKLLFGGNEGLEALQLPDGFRSMLAWLTDLAVAWCEGAAFRSDDIKEIDAIVLIDEIDLHLHPSLQRDLIPRLRRAMPRVQWVVTTHSPLVLGSFHESELVPLDSTQPGGIRKLDRSILGFSMDQVYQLLMGSSPMSSELETQIKNREQGRLGEADVDTILAMSPTVDAAQAAQKVARRKELLEKLRKGEL